MMRTRFMQNLEAESGEWARFLALPREQRRKLAPSFWQLMVEEYERITDADRQADKWLQGADARAECRRLAGIGQPDWDDLQYGYEQGKPL